MINYKFSAQESTTSSNYHSSQIFRSKTNETGTLPTSKFLMKQIIRYDNVNVNLEDSFSGRYVNILDADRVSIASRCTPSHDDDINTSTPTLDSKSSIQFSVCLSRQSIKPNDVDMHLKQCTGLPSSHLSKENNLYIEKSTYCRPALSYNDELIQKSLEKHARLQKLVKKLINARKKEKESEGCNSVINLNNYTEKCTRYHCKPQSKVTRNVEEDMERQNSSHCSSQRFSDFYCYPISSQARLLMFNKKKSDPHPSEWQGRPLNRPIFVSNISVNNPNTQRQSLAQNKACCACTGNTKDTESRIAQTDNYILPPQYEIKGQQYDRVSEDSNKSKDDQSILKSIEDKVNTLVNSFNSFMKEVKLKTIMCRSFECRSVSLDPPKFSQNISACSDQSSQFIREEKLACNIFEDQNDEPVRLSDLNRVAYDNLQSANIHNVIIEEIKNTNNYKEEIKNINCTNHNSTVTSYDTIIREKYNKMTGSPVLRLEDRSVLVSEEESGLQREVSAVTIGVNTDPLGLYALLTVSTEAAKQFLSSNIQRPRVTHVNQSEGAYFSCNICGQTFERPSELSNHVQGHHYGSARDCCVCRHLFECRQGQKMFECQYCGKQFSRAYCCDLHQQSCARINGVQHDVKPSLLILK